MTAHPFQFALLQHAQQPHLHRWRQGVDLVHKQGAAVGALEVTPMRLDGPGECPFFVTKQDALDDAFRDGAAIDGDEGLVGSVAHGVDGPRHQFLADPGFPFDQHGGRGGRQGFDGFQNTLHGPGLGDQDRSFEILGLHGARLGLAPKGMQALIDAALQVTGGPAQDRWVGVGPILDAWLHPGGFGVQMHQHRTLRMAKGDALLEFNLGIAEIARRDAAKDAGSHAAEFGRVPNALAEWTAAADDMHAPGIGRQQREVAADPVFQPNDKVNVTVTVEGILSGFGPKCLLEEAAGALGDTLDQLFAIAGFTLGAQVHEFEDKGLQEADRRQLGKAVIVHVSARRRCGLGSRGSHREARILKWVDGQDAIYLIYSENGGDSRLGVLAA